MSVTAAVAASSFDAMPVESTKWQNITVTCRRSPAVSGVGGEVEASGGCGLRGAGGETDASATNVSSSLAIAASTFRRCPRHADILEVLIGQMGQTERLILF
jgi:hypothetical protein